MIAHAKGRYIRVSPTKIRTTIDLIRGKDVVTSKAVLVQVNKGTAAAVHKVLDSAISNAKQKGLDETQLFISKITADFGPAWKRFRSAPFGRATRVLKRTTHLTIELDVITK